MDYILILSFEDESQIDDDNQTRKIMKIISKKNRSSKSYVWKVFADNHENHTQHVVLWLGQLQLSK